MNFHSSSILMSTALLICLENSFWDMTHINGDDVNFMESFKRSFKLYVESGTRKKVEASITLLRNEQGGRRLVTDSTDFRGKFYKLITEHLLRKFRCSLSMYLMHLTI